MNMIRQYAWFLAASDAGEKKRNVSFVVRSNLNRSMLIL